MKTGDTKNRLREKGLAPNKRFGQNFLTDENVIDRIIDAAGLDGGDEVLEIGPGTGALTRRLAERAGRVVAVEIDKGLSDMLTEDFKDSPAVDIVCGDILKLDLDALLSGRAPVKVVANLPYYITTPILLSLLPRESLFSRFVVMIQKEVADRMTAGSGSGDYGALSLAVQYYSTPSVVAIVPPSAFYPQPEVTSAVLKLERLSSGAVDVEDTEKMFKLIRAAFGKRRKTLVNAVTGALPDVPPQRLREALTELGLSENVRGEALTLEQFAALSDKI